LKLAWRLRTGEKKKKKKKKKTSLVVVVLHTVVPVAILDANDLDSLSHRHHHHVLLLQVDAMQTPGDRSACRRLQKQLRRLL
jgi:hypothetical protein